MSDDLVTWVTPHIDEDERVAREAWRGDGWRHENMPDEVWTGRSAPGHTPIPIAKAWDSATAEHIARHDPARVLREVEAKRRIVELYEAMVAGAEAADGTMLAGAAKVRLGAYGNVLRLLALPYADRDGYREEWRP